MNDWLHTLANWLEATGHTEGVIMLRWQRVSRPLDADDGPRVEVVASASLAARGDLAPQRLGGQAYARRIEARQVGVARRMLS